MSKEANWKIRNSLWRRIILPAIYAVRNEPVLRELKLLENSQWWQPHRIEELQQRRLLRLMKYCARSVPFYMGRLPNNLDQYRDANIHEILKSIPILEKDDVRSLSQVTKNSIRKFGRYISRHTAGTSGEPLMVYADGITNARSLAARIRCQSWFGVRVGDRECRLWGRSLCWHDRSRLAIKDFALNRYRVSPTELNKNLIKRTVLRVARNQPDYLYGYSSMVLELCERLASEVKDYKLRLKAVFLTAEANKQHERNRLSKLLGCPVADEYGCSEVDIIAHQCPQKNYHITAENMVVEVIPSDRADPMRGEICITDLNNSLMPLIRYRLGDQVTLSSEPCTCGRGLPIITSVSGRTLSQFFCFSDGRRVHAFVFDCFMNDLVASGIEIKQILFKQRERDKISILVVLKSDTQEIRSKVRNKLEKLIIPETRASASVELEFHDRIFRETGKKFEYFNPLLGL